MTSRALLVPFLLLAARALAAQPALVAEMTVDAEAYAYGAPITAHYAVRNEGTEPTVIWGSGSCKVGVRIGSFTSPGAANPCPSDSTSNAHRIAPGETLVWEWQLDPTALGIPETDGTQTLTGFVRGSCDPVAPTIHSCGLSAQTTFEAPRFLGGQISVGYYEVDADSAEAVLRSYNGRHVFNEGCCGSVWGIWRVEGTPVEDVVSALETNNVIIGAGAYRELYPGPPSYVTAAAPRVAGVRLSAPAPNPTAGPTVLALRLPTTGTVRVDVVDALGRRVAVLHDGPLAGDVDHPFRIDGGALPPGVYTVRVVGPGVRQVRRFVVAR